jgi:TatD DNase family protein
MRITFSERLVEARAKKGLKMELVDTHCHLQFDAYKSHENSVLSRAANAGVKRIICVGTSLEDSKSSIELAHNNKDIWASVGVHPHAASQFLADVNAPKKLRQLVSASRVVAVGETGLDYYKQHSSADDQKAVLIEHVGIAQRRGLPLIFHIREAFADFWKIFDTFKGLKGVVHSFSSNQADLNEILARGLYVGLNGIMTFTKDDSQLEAAKNIPLDKLLLETDAPFLTPAPKREELCEPRHVRITAEFLAKLWGEDLSEIAKASTANADKLFNLT